MLGHGTGLVRPSPSQWGQITAQARWRKKHLFARPTPHPTIGRLQVSHTQVVAGTTTRTLNGLTQGQGGQRFLAQWGTHLKEVENWGRDNSFKASVKNFQWIILETPGQEDPAITRPAGKVNLRRVRREFNARLCT